MDSNTRYIALPWCMFTLVDAEDFDELDKRLWYLDKQGYVIGCKGGKHVFMHRLINQTPRGFFTDHINGDRLDNRRSNLRTVTIQENSKNRRGLNSNNTSGYRGVSFCPGFGNHKPKKPWVANLDGKSLGRFGCKEDAAIAYNWALLKERKAEAALQQIYS